MRTTSPPETTPGTPGYLLLLDKPPGLSSSRFLYRLRGPLRIRRVGHAGTLDPFASGLLVAGIGSATRVLPHLADLPKEYEGIVRLGVVTDSQDPTGRVLGEAPVGEIPASRVLEEMARLTGGIEQVPPMASALRVDGERLYRIHRRGGTVERTPRPVRVERWELLALELPRIRFRVRCSKGTYVRTLAHDLGERLGPGGHLEALRRTRIGAFRVEDALGGEELATLRAPSDFVPHRIAPADALAHFPARVAGEEAASRIAFGIAPSLRELEAPGEAGAEAPGTPPGTAPVPGTTLRVLSRTGELLALMRVVGNGPGGEPLLAFVSVFTGGKGPG
jgi:tRNA pseudouridine55 synthase